MLLRGLRVRRARARARMKDGLMLRRATLPQLPEALRVVSRGNEKPLNTFAGRRRDTVYLGATARHQIELDDGTTLKVLTIHPRGEHGGDDGGMHLAVDADDIIILEN